MTNPSLTQSQKRSQESVGALFSGNGPKTFLFLKSSSDIGVIRNGGRNGARLAPQSFLSTFKKFSQDPFISQYRFHEFEVADIEEEKKNFPEAQKQEARRISSVLANFPKKPLCHIGGGHDHIYPLLISLSENFKKTIVINIDAHADTRTDSDFHSGTPFRQFAMDYKGDFKLYQMGLNPFANSFSTLTPLPRGEFKALWKKDISDKALENSFKEISSSIDRETLVVFSLDADALTASEVPGVSAVNPDGLTKNELMKIWHEYRKLPLPHSPVIGIYELNPVYDSLASISMRTIGSFLFETFRE